jgi:hypothetical protein
MSSLGINLPPDHRHLVWPWALCIFYSKQWNETKATKATAVLRGNHVKKTAPYAFCEHCKSGLYIITMDSRPVHDGWSDQSSK